MTYFLDKSAIKWIVISLLWMLSLFFVKPVNAIVDMRNSNYAQSWVDMEIPGTGYALNVSRTYNSKSLYDGMFGFGWCSDFETTLTVTAEGNLKVTECGAGQEQFFTPSNFGKKEIDQMVSAIVEKVKKEKKVDEKNLVEFKKDLYNDHDLRTKFASAYKVSLPVKDGTVFYANGKEVDKITLSKGVYTRDLPDGSNVRFSADGRVAYLYDKNGNYLKFSYEKNKIKEIVDNNGRKLNFKYFPNNKVQSITGPNNLVAEYKYNIDNLIWSKTASEKLEYKYEYDDAHNLTKVTYPDGKFIALTYDKKNDWVTSFTDAEKCNETYNYEFDEKNPKLHYWSTVKKTCNKEVVTNAKHEFWYAERKDGKNYLQRILSKVNDNETDISYHEVFGKPISIRRNSEKFTFDYYANGQVQNKHSDRTTQSYKYDPKLGKVSEVATTVKNEKGKTLSTKKTVFKYDNKGNLTYSENSEGMKITMTYDSKGRINQITDQSKKIVKIQYEERFGKPAVVTRPGLGTLNISYKNSGDIDKVNSDQGPTVAMQVASVFNNLLDIISPATAEVFQ